MKRMASVIAFLPLLIPAIVHSYTPGPMMSPWQAYPASCVSSSMMDDGGGMMMSSFGPTWTSRVELPTVNGPFSGPVGTEFVTFTFWRMPCSGGRSALLGRVARDHAGFPAPVFGGMFGSQGSYSHQMLRISRDPNTMWSDVTGMPIMTGFDFVIENSSDYQIDFSQSMGLSINGMSTVSMMIPAYDSASYPSAQLPMQMSGYMTGNWFDPNHSGEGLQVEVGETSSTGRYMIFAWYTFDSNGRPFWLFGQGGFNAGDRSANVTMAYAMGGGFAGGFGAAAANAHWGTLVVQFPDCKTMQFSYQADSGLPVDVPHGSGSRTWTRLTAVNGLGCD